MLPPAPSSPARSRESRVKKPPALTLVDSRALPPGFEKSRSLTGALSDGSGSSGTADQLQQQRLSSGANQSSGNSRWKPAIGLRRPGLRQLSPPPRRGGGGRSAAAASARPTSAACASLAEYRFLFSLFFYGLGGSLRRSKGLQKFAPGHLFPVFWVRKVAGRRSRSPISSRGLAPLSMLSAALGLGSFFSGEGGRRDSPSAPQNTDAGTAGAGSKESVRK